VAHRVTRAPPKNDKERTALHKLRERGYPFPSGDYLVMTAGQGDLELVKLFLEAGYSPDTSTAPRPPSSTPRGGTVGLETALGLLGVLDVAVGCF
jgi:hypothetical protein